MLQYPGAAIEVRNHRQVLTNLRCLIQFSSQGNAQDSCCQKMKLKEKKKKPNSDYQDSWHVCNFK